MGSLANLTDLADVKRVLDADLVVEARRTLGADGKDTEGGLLQRLYRDHEGFYVYVEGPDIYRRSWRHWGDCLLQANLQGAFGWEIVPRESGNDRLTLKEVALQLHTSQDTLRRRLLEGVIDGEVTKKKKNCSYHIFRREVWRLLSEKALPEKALKQEA